MAHKHGKRDDLLTQIATPVLPSPAITPVTWSQTQPLTEISDHRTWHPLGNQRPALTVSTRHKLKIAGPRNKLKYPSAHVAFQQPGQLDVCIRRKTRRQVLHALKRTRSGRGKSKRRKPYSNIRC